MNLNKLIKKFVSDKRFFLIELGFIVLIASYKQFWSHQYYQLRIYLCVVIVFYTIFVSKLIGLNREKLGFKTSNWLISFKQLMLPALTFFATLFLLKLFWPSLFVFGIHYNSINEVIYRLLAYAIISVPVQEVIFRGYVTYRLEHFSRNKVFIVVVSALIFSSIHWPLKSLLLTVGTFVFGIFLSVNFIKFRNLYSLMIIHGVLGAIVTLLSVQLN